ncbi:hypothetical protein HO133_001110 [Letharia lupina]|uniref:Rhodopsin domain-containing protein n=1 Tax=Letharia lupina TaxID=560253 RepID=A0A8H6CGP1_9LECA|nr:uncharacterized protein HO133_001110 [Letharia lupina]KAF6223058.1 hypothetical protein HO133_001110 [Letharia lupina]
MSTDTPPPGLDLYADQRGRVIGSCAAIISLTFIFVFLRLLSRKLSRAGFWWDDLLTVVALIFSTVCCIIWLIEIPNGFGRHIYVFGPVLSIEKGKLFLKGLFVFEIFFHTATTLSKFAILAFYYRIFPILQFRRLLLWVAVLSVVYMVSIDLTIIFQCHPVHYAWDRVDPSIKGHCYNVDDFFIGSGSANVGLNFLIFILPIPLLWRLRTTVKQQIVLTVLFTLAGFVVLVSIIWVVVLSRLEEADVTWNYVDTAIWSALEPNMAVICACIPSLRPLVSVASQGFANAPLVRSTLHSAGGTSSRRMWEGGKGKSSDGTFSQLDEPDDLRPLGHDVSVRGGRVNDTQPDVEAMELPQTGINVRTEVILSTSDRLHYNDRLF